MGPTKFIQIVLGHGAMICALDEEGRVWIFNHNTQVWDKLPEKRNDNGSTKQSPLATLK